MQDKPAFFVYNKNKAAGIRRGRLPARKEQLTMKHLQTQTLLTALLAFTLLAALPPPGLR